MTSEDLTAAGLLRQARQRAGISQVELAARAGVTQSVISAYESGHRQPSVPTLAALIEATGSGRQPTPTGKQVQISTRYSGGEGRKAINECH